MKRITKILLCALCAVAAVLCVAAACFMLLKKQSGTTANSAASGASVSTYGKVSDFDYASFDYSEGLDDNGHWTGIRALDYVTLPEDVSALPLSKADLEPTETEIQTQIDTLLNQYATTQNITDRAAQSGDTTQQWTGKTHIGFCLHITGLLLEIDPGPDKGDEGGQTDLQPPLFCCQKVPHFVDKKQQDKSCCIAPAK